MVKVILQLMLLFVKFLTKEKDEEQEFRKALATGHLDVASDLFVKRLRKINSAQR